MDSNLLHYRALSRSGTVKGLDGQSSQRRESAIPFAVTPFSSRIAFNWRGKAVGM
jgi:hypothetical protein